MATKEAQDEAACATAHFSTYEDLSSRLFLIPFHDDDCRGAKVCSHEVVIESPHRNQAQQQKESTPVPETDGSASDSKETESVSNSTTNAGSATETVDEASDYNGKSAADDSDAIPQLTMLMQRKMLQLMAVVKMGNLNQIHVTMWRHLNIPSRQAMF
jgi:hypothetical protein